MWRIGVVWETTLILCANLLKGEKLVLKGSNVRMHIQEWSSCITIALTRRSFVLSTQNHYISVNMEISVLSLIARPKSELSWYTTTSSMRISTCSTTKQNSVLSTWLNMTKPCVCMRTIYRIIEEAPPHTGTNLWHVSTGKWQSSFIPTRVAAPMAPIATCAMGGRNSNTTPMSTKLGSACRKTAEEGTVPIPTPKGRGDKLRTMLSIESFAMLLRIGS